MYRFHTISRFSGRVILLSGQFLSSTVEFFIAHSTYGLFLLSFIESSFFPIPPDMVLIALALNNPGLSLWYALVTTIASVMGSVLGYFIGIRAGRPLLERWISKQRIQQAENLFSKYSGWAVAIAGFTPIPYKVITIASGVFRINQAVFITASILSRGARFFLEGMLIYMIGAQAKEFITSYFETITLTVTLVVIILYILLRHTKFVIHLQKLSSSIKEQFKIYCKRMPH